MTRSAVLPPAAAAAILSSEKLAAETSHPSDASAKRPHHNRRCARSAAVRGGGRRSGPTTPLLRWKFDYSTKLPSSPKPPKQRRNGYAAGADVAPAVPPSPPPALSVRQLTAALWQLQSPELGAGRDRPEHFPEHLQASPACNPIGIGVHMKKNRNELSNSISTHRLENGVSNKLGVCKILQTCAMEKATKWDPGSKVLDEVNQFYSIRKSFEEQKGNTFSVVSTLHAALEEAHVVITNLEAEKRSGKEKLDHFINKLAEEKASWRSREHEKVRAIIDGIKSDLKRERKNRKRMEIVNSKLVNELTEAKLSAKQFMQDYEKERKARELMDEVCNELAKKISKDKAEVESLKTESLKSREEIEEERRMLQMAEVWREERVQMKLIDAKLILDEKYSQLSKLQADIESYLDSKNASNLTPEETKEAEVLNDAIISVKIQDIKKFTYQPPPASEDIYSILEELQARLEPNVKDTEQCYGYTPTSHASNIHTLSPDINDFLEKPKNSYAKDSICRHEDMEDDSGWETVSHIEEQGFSNSPEGSDPSVNGKYRDSTASLSETDWEENDGDNGRTYSESSEVCSVGTKQSRKKISSISRFWKSSNPNNGKNYKKAPVEALKGRLLNGRMSNATLSPEGRSIELGLTPESLGQRSSPESMNPHITRGMKGCIEWPKGLQKHNLKANILEASVERQKIQLRQVLKQKI